MKRWFHFLAVFLTSLSLALPSEPVSLRFEGVSLRAALDLWAKAAGVRVLLLEQEAAPVTLDLAEVPADRALWAILQAAGGKLDYVEVEGGLVVVGPRDRVRQLRPGVFRLYERLPKEVMSLFPEAVVMEVSGAGLLVYASPEEHERIASLASSLASFAGTVSFPVRSPKAKDVVEALGLGVSAFYVEEAGRLVVRGDPRQLVAVKEALEAAGLYGEAERAEPAVLRFFPVRYREPKEALEVLKEQLGEEAVKGFVADEVLRGLLGAATARQAERVSRFLEVYDRPARQYEILVRVEQMDEQAARSLGINWEGALGAFSVGVAEGGLSFGFDLATRSALSLLSSLAALETKGLSRTLVNTRLVAVDGREATVRSGGQLLLPQAPQAQTGGGTGGSAAPGGYLSVPYGLNVKVSPRGLGEGEVLLDVAVSLGGTPASGPGQGVALPSQDVASRLRLPLGSTVVLGGVITEVQQEGVRGVPVLSWIPLLGELFKQRTGGTNTSAVLVFLTVRPL